jgi:outer membrane protein OmpA-like peptidoglycan-associated protein
MKKQLRAVAVGALVLPFMAGCATKGWVRTSLANERAITDSAFATERSARIAGDSALANDIATLRRDLDGLRTEFGAKITAMEQGMQFAFPVNFAFDDATLREEDRPALERFAAVVNRHYPGSTITVEGFADPAGSVRYNLDLSRRRAETVRSYLTTQGLTDLNLRAVGYGEARQVVEGAERDDAGAEQNRRVVFVVESRGQPATGVTSMPN